MSGYAFHPEAEVDLDAVWDYVAEDSHDAADRFVGRIRFVSVGSYLIAYVPDQKPVWVVAVMHGRRSPRVLAAILRGRE